MKAENILYFFCIVVVAIAAYFAVGGMHVGAGYSAKLVCSGTFTAKRDFDAVVREEVGPSVALYSITKGDRSVTSSALFGLIKRVATYSPVRNSCTLTAPGDDSSVWDTIKKIDVPLISDTSDEEWPLGDKNALDTSNLAIDTVALANLMDASFHAPVRREACIFRDTKALIVLYDGKIIAERYAESYTPSTPILGWSMTKSVISTLIGARIQENKLQLSDNKLFAEWDDERADITVDQLLRASSGLQFHELSGLNSDTSEMLFSSADPVTFAKEKKLEHKIDTTWSYSSGTTNLLCDVLRKSFATDSEYWNYPKTFFSQLGMNSIVVDTDASGTFTGSSFAHASLRDWARFGLFTLQRGEWMGKQILPKSWFDYALTASPTAPLGQYGAQWWLNAGAKDNPSDRLMPSIPTDAFFAQGYQGQTVAGIPSKKLVVVRLGLTSPDTAWNMEGFLKYTIDNIIKE